MQEWWEQGRRHKHRNHIGFLWEDKSSTEKSMWVAPSGGEAEPEGRDAIENWAREERPGKEELNQSRSLDLIQYQRGKAAQQLLNGREEDLISQEVKWRQHNYCGSCCRSVLLGLPLYFSLWSLRMESIRHRPVSSPHKFIKLLQAQLFTLALFSWKQDFRRSVTPHLHPWPQEHFINAGAI